MSEGRRTGDDLLDRVTDVEPSEAPQLAAKPILERWELTHEQFTEIVDANPSLRGVTLGYVAEWKFHQMFLNHPDVSQIRKDDDHDRRRKGDRTFQYKGHKFTVEVKSLQTNLVKKEGAVWKGKSQVDASDRRKVIFKDGSYLPESVLSSARTRSASPSV